MKVTKKDLETVQRVNTAYIDAIGAAKDYVINSASALYVSNLAEKILRFARIAGDIADNMTDAPTGYTVFTVCKMAADRHRDNEQCFPVVEAVLRLGVSVQDIQTENGRIIFTQCTKSNLVHSVADALQSLLKDADRVDWRGNITRGKNGVKHAMEIYFNASLREMGFNSKLF